MSRPRPTTALPLVPSQANPAPGTVTQVRHYRLITPLFGGGVQPGVADPVQVVRGAEVRGQLRFWWRATRGGQYATLSRLKQAEAELWGAASLPGQPAVSRVQVAIVPLYWGTEFKAVNNRGEPVNIGTPASPYSYVAFPLRDNPHPGAKPITGIEFYLHITFPDNTADRAAVEAALWAWETFGGLGARTRRGFGALELLDSSENGGPATPPDLPTANETACRAWLRGKLQAYVQPWQGDARVPHLTPTAAFRVKVRPVGPQDDPALVHWRYLFEQLKQFRQMRNPGQQPNRPGRSRWPEADVIRNLTGHSAPQHRIPIIQPLLRKFPRASFGLPLIFQFQQQVPAQTTLHGLHHDRLASPLIVRPIACQNGLAVSLAVLLDGPRTPPGGLQLGGPGGPWPATADLTPAEAALITRPNGTPLLGNKTDVLLAFLDYLEAAS